MDEGDLRQSKSKKIKIIFHSFLKNIIKFPMSSYFASRNFNVHDKNICFADCDFLRVLFVYLTVTTRVSEIVLIKI